MDLECIMLSEINQTKRDKTVCLTDMRNLKKPNSEKKRVEWWGRNLRKRVCTLQKTGYGTGMGGNSVGNFELSNS